MKKKFIIPIVLISILVFYIIYRAAFVHEKVQTVSVKRGNLITLVYATGSATADSVATLRSESGGIVKFISGKEGSYVKKGQVLLRTDQKDEALRLKDAENQIEQTKIDLTAKQRDLERKENLFRTNSITKKEVEDARQAFELANVSLRQKQIALDQARQNITNTEIIAPFSGVLINVRVNLGDYLTPNAECFEILAPSSILVQGDVDEQDLGRISRGMTSVISFDAFPNEKYEGVIQRITPRTDETTKTSKVYIRLANIPEKLNIGMTATINIKANEKDNILLLPRTAIQQDNTGSYVYTITNDKRLKKISLALTGLSDGKYSEIPDGKLSEGEKVVDQPKNTLKDNMKVEMD
ncbi:MAG: efflux RND transporter periplasmic adaptor subunit [Bacillota bacterium]